MFDTPELGAAEERVLTQVDALKASLRSRLTQPPRWVDSVHRLSLARAIQGSNSIEGYEAGSTTPSTWRLARTRSTSVRRHGSRSTVTATR